MSKRAPKKKRDLVILGMILTKKNTFLRDRRMRRAKDARKVREDFQC